MKNEFHIGKKYFPFLIIVSMTFLGGSFILFLLMLGRICEQELSVGLFLIIFYFS